MSNAEKTKLTLELPDGALLIAARQEDAEYLRMAIYLHRLNEPDELLCFAEYNPSKPKGQELCVGAYGETDDEPAYYGSYHNKKED
jgi:hypothetical protein